MSEDTSEGLDRKKAKELFRSALMDHVANGWHIEIENGYEAVLSRKKSFNWIPHVLFIIVTLFFAPILSFVWFFVMIIIAVTTKSRTKRLWLDPEGELHFR